MTTLPASDDITEKVYELVADEHGEGRACDGIPDDACTDVPQNFLLNAANGACTKLAEQLASPGLVLPWLFAAIGAPIALVGLLSPIKEAGSLLPQLAVAGRIRAVSIRKWFWVGAGLCQAAALGAIGGVALALDGLLAGAIIVALLAVFSIASGVGSVAFKDVMGKTIPKGRRGRLLAVRASVGGALTLIAGVLMRVFLADESDVAPYVLLVALAAILWAISAIIFAMIREEPGATKGGRNALSEAKAGISLLRDNVGLRWFLTSRALLASVPLSMPFFALYARRETGGELGELGVLVVATGLSQVIASPIWGKFSDRSSRRVMMIGGVLGALTGALALGLGRLPGEYQTSWVFASIFVLNSFAHAGCRLGRKTYIVDGAPKDERPLYVSISNTLIGVAILAAGALGPLGEVIGLETLIIVLAALGLLGAAAAWIMPEAEALAPTD